MFVQIDEYIESKEIKLTGALHRTKVPELLIDELKERFLDLFCQSGIVDEVCSQMGISSGTVYHWRRKDKDFATEWDRVRREELLPILEDKAFRRATDSEKPDSNMLMFLLKSYNRKQYDDKHTETNQKPNTINVNILDVDGSKIIDSSEVKKLEESNNGNEFTAIGEESKKIA